MTTTRPPALLGRDEWVYIVASLVPIVALDVLAKLQRIQRLGTADGLMDHLDQVRSETVVGCSVIALWGGVLALVRTSRGRLASTLALHAFAVVWLLLIVVNHVYFMTTGMGLDLQTIVTAVGAIDELTGLLHAVVPAAMWIGLALLLACVALLPAVLSRRWSGSFVPLVRRSTSTPRRTALVAVGLGVALLAVASVPTLTVGSSFGRESVVSLVAQGVSTSKMPVPDGYTPPTASDVPTDTRLTRSGEGRKKNFVLIALESTRYSATSLGDPQLDTTPYLAELAQTSLVATQAHSVVPHTTKALVAMHCGVVPPLDGRNTEAEPGGIAARCLPELLKEQGYRTAFFQSATSKFERRRDVVDRLGFDGFFPVETMPTKGFEPVNYFGFEDDIMLAPIRSWTEKHRDEPFAMSVLTVSTHHDYVVPKGWPTEKYSDDPMLDDYLNLVRYEDQFVRHLVEQFKQQGLYDNTVFVILGDHGEGFGEHHRWQHDGTIYEEGLRIPLLIHDGSAPKGRVIDSPVTNTAVLPTVAEMLGFRIDGGTYAVPSLLSGQPRPPVVASCFRPSQCAAVTEGDIKLIHHFGVLDDELFDLARDPLERNNLIDAWDPEEVARLEDEISAWIQRAADLQRIHRS